MPYSQYSLKQKRLAAMAGDRKKITQADVKRMKLAISRRGKKA
jgi:hypothetical protein